MSIWGIIATVLLFIVMANLGQKQNRSEFEINDIETSSIGLGLSCPIDMPLAIGTTWRGITIGESSLIDLNDLYGVIASHVGPSQPLTEYADVYEISLTREVAQSRRIAQGAKTCLINNKIAALYLSVGFDSELPDTDYESWKNKYGEPNIVTWSTSGDWYRRTVIWNSPGVIVDVDIIGSVDEIPAAQVNGVVFFLPLNGDDLASVWPYNQLDVEQPTSDPPAENLKAKNPL